MRIQRPGQFRKKVPISQRWLPLLVRLGRSPPTVVMTSEGLASAPRLERLLAPLGSGSERDLPIDETEAEVSLISTALC